MALTTEQRSKIIIMLAARHRVYIQQLPDYVMRVWINAGDEQRYVEYYNSLSDADLMALVLGAKDE